MVEECKQKSGERCGKAGQQGTQDDGKKQWRAKEIKETTPRLDVVTVEKLPEQNTEGNTPWTEVANHRKHKGKAIEGTLPEKSIEVNCHNGFESLRDVPGSSNPLGE